MKRTKALFLTLTVAALVISVTGCGKLLKPDPKAAADNALVIIKALRGTTGSCYEPDGSDGFFGTDGVDSAYTDEIERGVRTTGWLFYDDRETPFDSTDDVFSFRGQKNYLDWGVIENVWLSIHVWTCDRATEMAVRNTGNQDSSCISLGRVTRPGGLQTGPSYWTNGSQSIDLVAGVHHNETPDDWSDNYSYFEFDLPDSREASTSYFVHADFRPDRSGSGELRQTDRSGELVATFEWDNFGRGSLVVGGDIYPFEWK